MYEYNVCLYPTRESAAFQVRVCSDQVLSEYEAVKLFLDAMQQCGFTSVQFASVVCLNYRFPYHFAHGVSCAHVDVVS